VAPRNVSYLKPGRTKGLRGKRVETTEQRMRREVALIEHFDGQVATKKGRVRMGRLKGEILPRLLLTRLILIGMGKSRSATKNVGLGRRVVCTKGLLLEKDQFCKDDMGSAPLMTSRSPGEGPWENNGQGRGGGLRGELILHQKARERENSGRNEREGNKKAKERSRGSAWGKSRGMNILNL